MHHVAIMRKDWGLTEKILSGKKSIESRWYKNKSRPWDSISIGDTVFFKDSGSPVTLKATVRKVIQYCNLTPHMVRKILDKYAKRDGIDQKDVQKFYGLFKDKKYCLLIFLQDPVSVRPFNITKKGFGAMSAWITVDNIKQIVLD